MIVTPRVIGNAFLGFVGVCLVAIIWRFIVWPAMHVKHIEPMYGDVLALRCSCGSWTTCTEATIDEAIERVHEVAS